MKVRSLSRVRFFATPWTVAYEAFPPMGFSRQEYWSGVPLPEAWVQSLGQEDSLQEGMTTHSSLLAWEIPWTEETSELQSIEMKKISHDYSN